MSYGPPQATGGPPSVTSGDTAALSFFASWLVEHADRGFTDADVLLGLNPDVLQSAPVDPPAVPTSPAFAVVDDGGDLLSMAYWDFGQGALGSWAVVPYPWTFPFLLPGHIIVQDSANGAGVNNWLFAMGCECRVKNAGRITDLSVKYGNAGLQHRWEIVKSTVTGPTAPAFATYTNVVATGLYTNGVANVWESVGIGAPIVVAPDEWFLGWSFIGNGAGQFASITALRDTGQLLEDYADLNAGIFLFIGGANPGPTPLGIPTSRQPATVYGMASLEFSAP